MSVRISLPETMARRGRGRWKMNIELLKEQSFKDGLTTCVQQWRAYGSRYADVIEWWDNYAKKQIKIQFIRKGTEKNKEDKAYINFLHTCIYEILQGDACERTKTAAINKFKAKILLLHKRKMEKTILNIQKYAPAQNEKVSIFHLLKSKQRRASTMIESIIDDEGTEHSAIHGITRTIRQHMQRRYAASTIDEDS
jgi:hypothetical protein